MTPKLLLRRLEAREREARSAADLGQVGRVGASDETALDPDRLRVVAERTGRERARGQGERRTVRSGERVVVLVPGRVRGTHACAGEVRVVDSSRERGMAP